MTGNKNILVLTYWSFNEALIQTYTLPYLDIIKKNLPHENKIFLVTLEQEHLRMNEAERNKTRESLKTRGIEWIPLTYHKWGLTGIFFSKLYIMKLTLLIFTKRIKYIHAWCTPAAAIGYILSLITGRKLIVDSYEPHAEAMVENGEWKRNDLKFKFLFFLEKKLSERAYATIGVVEKMKDYAKEKYGVALKRFFVKPACVDIETYVRTKTNLELKQQLGFENKIICVYAGKFGGIYLTKEVFDFFKVAETYWGDSFRALLLTPTKEEELVRMATTAGFDPHKMKVLFVNHNEVAVYLRLASFAITPVKPVPTKRYCTPIKDGEYWATGLPVVITKNISDDSEIIEKNNIGAVINELNDQSYLDAIKKIDLLLKSETSDGLSELIISIAKKHRSFSIAEEIYEKIYRGVI